MTVRDRDTMEQVRMPVSELKAWLARKAAHSDMSASEKRSLRERLRPKERKPAVRWLLTVLLLAAAVLGLHMLLQMIGTLDFSRGRFSLPTCMCRRSTC